MKISDEAVAEWGTDLWGEILSEPNEAHARKVASDTGASLYERSPAGQWILSAGAGE